MSYYKELSTVFYKEDVFSSDTLYDAYCKYCPLRTTRLVRLSYNDVMALQMQDECNARADFLCPAMAEVKKQRSM